MASNILYSVTHGTTSPNGAAPLSATYSVFGGTQTLIDQTLPIGTNQLVAASWLAAGTSAGDLQMIEIIASQNFTLKTNSSSTPADTINFTAGIPLIWDIATVITYPFAGAVTAWYITNAAAMRIQARILVL